MVMAIFLLIYVLFLITWLSWSAVITSVFLKYRYPDKFALKYLAAYWIVSLIILVVTLIFILRADWVTVPSFFKSMGV